MTQQWLTYPIISEVALEIGPLAIRWYAIAYLAGITIAMLLLNNEAKKDHTFFNTEDVAKLTNNCVIGILIGGRLGFVLFYNLEFYFSSPLEILKIWNGGMSFHGGFLGVIIATFVTVRKTDIPIFHLADHLACVAPIGLFFGRIANFINGELYGRVTDHPIGIIFPQGGPLPRHPSQLYEALLEGLLLFIILNTLKIFPRKIPLGLLTGLFFLIYGLSRVAVEFLREPDSNIGFIGSVGMFEVTMGQLLSIPLIIVGCIVTYFSSKNKLQSR